MAPEGKDGLEKQARIAAIVILVTFPLWMLASWAGGTYGWQPRYAILFDLSALAAFVWAMVVLYQVWRKRQQNR